MRTIPSNWLAAYVFALALAAGVWVYGRNVPWALWIAALALVAALWKWPFLLELPDVEARIGWRDAALTLLIAAPAIVTLGATWRQEFPTSGDIWLHNGYAIEAFAFWWPWRWLAAVAAIVAIGVAVRRHPRSVLPLAGVAAVAVLAAFNLRALFAGRYPSLLHFAAVPVRVLLPFIEGPTVERLLNTMSIPVWLLVLRPRLLGRGVDLSALTVGALLFWQKDVVYYTTSGYLEPWALVLILTAGEHLLRFRETASWRPFLLIGAAALVKDQMILMLPVAAAVCFPRRGWLPYLATVSAALMPFLLWAGHPGSNARRGSGLAPMVLLFGEHAVSWRERVTLQFGIALPLVILGLVALVALAVRNRGALVLLLAAAADGAIFFSSNVQMEWPGYPRTTLVPLACCALALGFALERFRRIAVPAVALILTANFLPLAPFLRDAFAPSDTRNFIEHHNSPLFYPIREALEGETSLHPGDAVGLLYNGRRLYSFYFPGLPGEEYPGLAARYRLRLQSFAGAPERCRCTGGDAKLGLFIRFNNLGASIPQRAAVEAEAAQCRAALEATCPRRKAIVHDGTVVGLLGMAR